MSFWFSLLSATATEFGGGVHGADPVVDRTLGSLDPAGPLRWIRGGSPRVAKHGFQGLFDIRSLMTQTARDRHRLPEDLLATYRACRDRLPDFPGSPRVFEVWNEPDFYFVNDSAADMAASLKAAWWGVKTRMPHALVLMPSLAFRPGRYAIELAANGVASWTDGWNLHFYGWSSDFADFLAHHRTFASAIGCDRPFWLTEIGYIGMTAGDADDPLAQATQTAFHERTMIESWALGVDRHLLFQLTPFTEGRNELGLTDAEGRWRPALERAVRVARALEITRPLFRIRHETFGEDVGLVLDRGDDQWWTILWSPERPGEVPVPGMRIRHGSAKEFRLDVDWPKRWNEVRLGFDGDTALAPSQVVALEPTPWRNLHVHGPSEPFRLKGCRWIPWSASNVETPSIESRARKELDSLPPRRAPSPVVVRWRMPSPFVTDKASQTVRLPSGEVLADTTIQFHNFSDQPQSGEWSLDAPPGWSVLGPPPPHRLTIPPLDRREVRLRLSPREEAGARPGMPGRLNARWTDAIGHVDEASVRLVADAAGLSTWWEWSWRNFLADPRQADTWQVYARDEGGSTIEVRSVGGLNREIAVHLKLPRGVQETDRFRVTLRHVSGGGFPHVQIHMTTATGETWRYGEMLALEHEFAKVDAALGDFSPAIWSRHRTFLFPPVAEAIGLTLQFQGMEPGDVIEFDRPSLGRLPKRGRG